MRSSKFFIIIGLISIFLLFSLDSSAQRSRKKKSRKDRDNREQQAVRVPFKDKLWYVLNFGNLGFSNNSFGFSGKAAAGYKVTKRIGVAIIAKTFYDTYGIQGADDLTLWSYGTGMMGRVKLTNSFYFQGEYDFTNYALFDRTHKWYGYPMLGGGYSSTNPDGWNGGISLLFNLNEEVRDIGSISFGEYWISFTLNF